MPNKRTTIIEEHPVSSDNAPGVIAYRVGELERAVKQGFREHNDKLDSVINNLATKGDISELTIRLDDHEDRLRSLQTDRDRMQGAIKVIYAALVLIVGLMGALWWLKG